MEQLLYTASDVESAFLYFAPGQPNKVVGEFERFN